MKPGNQISYDHGANSNRRDVWEMSVSDFHVSCPPLFMSSGLFIWRRNHS